MDRAERQQLTERIAGLLRQAAASRAEAFVRGPTWNDHALQMAIADALEQLARETAARLTDTTDLGGR